MSKKVFAFDIDGTFIDSNYKVHPGHIEALQQAKAKGHILALCSGRPYYDMTPVLDQIPSDLFDYLICNNGAYTVEVKTGEKFMDQEVPLKVLEDYRALKDLDKYNFAVHTLCSTTRGNTWTDPKDAPQWYIDGVENMHEKSKYFKTWEDTVEGIENKRISQLSLLGTKEGVQKAKAHFEKLGHDVDIHIGGEVYLDINPSGVDKMRGLENLSQIVNIPTSEFVAFGDSGNDLQMLAGAGLGIAMGNATEEAKKAAKLVIGSHDTTALADKVLELI